MDVRFPPLLEARLIVRENRFVVQAELPGGKLVKAHTNNTGRMRTCSSPGSRIFLSESSNPKRKLNATGEQASCGANWADGQTGCQPTHC